MSIFQTASPMTIEFGSLRSNEEELYLDEWTHSSRFLFYSIVFITIITLPLLISSYFYVRCYQKFQFVPYFCAILIANTVLLTTLFISVTIENTYVVYDIIPGFIICKMTAFLVNTSSCFIHWSWVAMYGQRFIVVFFPLRARRNEPLSSSIILLTILVFSSIFQLWTPIFITGRRLDTNDDQVDSMYCGEDPQYSGHSTLIVIIECTVTFFIPLALTVLADFSVLMWRNSCAEHFTLISNEEIGDGHRKSSHLKIMSSDKIKTSKKKRSIAIRKCLISATITLLLNLPNYSLQLFDEFFALRDNSDIEIRRLFLRIDAFVYLLYLIQFPITPIHIFLFYRIPKKRKSRSRSFTNIQNAECSSLKHNSMNEGNTTAIC